MLSFLVKPPQRTRVAHLNKIAFDDGRSCIEFKAPSDQYLVINRLPPAPQEEASTDKHGIEGPSSPNCALNPPLHWHSRQDEFFHVLHGKAAFYLEDRKHIATAGEVVEIPGGVYHTFRNTQTYRDDCRKAGIPRNLCQVLMFNYRANVVLALPGPKFIAKPLGLLLNFFAAWAGTVIFGFRDSYPEYFDRQRPSSRP
ncbi:hypothetical protein EDD37DRAFT_59553 [Exophiala viscosa]|uniref:uncharacterized protein n=1 Tax=Exophiala viscosa TaxID=2486360 RepID=UPI002197949E|nr:hypothetical protein EDD37DRAFT_59553 [Exophiala viscosa]